MPFVPQFVPRKGTPESRIPGILLMDYEENPTIACVPLSSTMPIEIKDLA